MDSNTASALTAGQEVWWKVPNSEIWIPAKVVSPYDKGYVLITFEADYQVLGVYVKQGEKKQVGTMFLSAQVETTKGRKTLAQPLQPAS